MAAVEHPPYEDRRAAPRGAPTKRRELPHNAELEASILGGILSFNEVLPDLGDLETSDFYDLKHRVVFEAIRNLQAADRPIGVVMLELEIERQGKLDAVGGVAFLGELALSAAIPHNIRAYRDEVRLLARNRRAIIELSSAVERAYTWAHDPAELISEVLGDLGRLEDLSRPAPKRMGLITVEESLQDLAHLATVPVFPTPFDALNKAIGFDGLLGTQVYTLAAGTGRGKTTFVSHVAAHTAMLDIPVVVVSYEMKPGYFIARKAAGAIGVHSNDIIRGHVARDRILAAIPNHPLISLMHKPSLAQLREAVRYVTKKSGRAPLLVVDYIQKLADEIALGQQRPDLRLATSIASSTLCDIAEETGAAVIAVSAIGRGKGRVLANPRKLPPYELVEVAKESGAVEYDGAGLIVISLSDDMEIDERIATVTVAKARFGSECHIDARYDGRLGTWRTLERVNVVPKAVTPADTGAVATAIAAVLKKHGPLGSKSKIWKLSGRGKQAIMSEIDSMLTAGSLVMSSLGFALPDQASELDAPPSQAELTGVRP